MKCGGTIISKLSRKSLSQTTKKKADSLAIGMKKTDDKSSGKKTGDKGLDEKKCVCKVCFKGFQYPSKLQEHLRVHIKQKKFQSKAQSLAAKYSMKAKVTTKYKKTHKRLGEETQSDSSASKTDIGKRVKEGKQVEEDLQKSRSEENQPTIKASSTVKQELFSNLELEAATPNRENPITDSNDNEEPIITYSNIKPFSCEWCLFRFENAEALKKHQTENCSEKTFLQENQREKKPENVSKSSPHIGSVEKAEVVYFSCDSCNKKFKFRKMYQMHMMKSQCKVTEKPQQENTESNESSDVATNKTTTPEDSHSLSIISYLGNTVVKKDVSSKRSLMKTKEAKIHPCPVCNEKFTRKDTVERHLKRHYGGDFMCKFCGLEYMTIAEVNKHTATAHNTGPTNQKGDLQNVAEKSKPAPTASKFKASAGETDSTEEGKMANNRNYCEGSEDIEDSTPHAMESLDDVKNKENANIENKESNVQLENTQGNSAKKDEEKEHEKTDESIYESSFDTKTETSLKNEEDQMNSQLERSNEFSMTGTKLNESESVLKIESDFTNADDDGRCTRIESYTEMSDIDTGRESRSQSREHDSDGNPPNITGRPFISQSLSELGPNENEKMNSDIGPPIIDKQQWSEPTAHK